VSLQKFTNIEGVRLNKNYNPVFDKTKLEFSVNNLYLEFKVGRQWLPFSHLSDGEQRLFYIFSEIASPTLFYFTKSKFTLNTGETNKIVLIEEPELGLHPHQLDSLLHFLRESSNRQQIIITTHAPQILDILNRDELNKIIVARLSGNGTKLGHLTRKEQEKASLYMEEEAYLSDYWKYSDLEK
jgi:predicted ATPase